MALLLQSFFASLVKLKFKLSLWVGIIIVGMVMEDHKAGSLLLIVNI